MATQTFTGTVESVDTREFAPYRQYGYTPDRDIQVQLRLIEDSGRLVCVETGAGRLVNRRFEPANAPWPFLIESDGVPVSTLYTGDRVTITGTLKGPERTSKRGTRYVVVNRAKVSAVLVHDGQNADGSAAPVSAPVAQPAPVRREVVRSVATDYRGRNRVVATIREAPRPEPTLGDLVASGQLIDNTPRRRSADTCKHGQVIYSSDDCDLCEAEEAAAEEAAQVAEGTTSATEQGTWWTAQRPL